VALSINYKNGTHRHCTNKLYHKNLANTKQWGTSYCYQSVHQQKKKTLCYWIKLFIREMEENSGDHPNSTESVNSHKSGVYGYVRVVYRPPK